MQTVIHREICQGINLTCVTSYKFKTSCMSMTLLTQLDKKTAALNAVLPSVLRRGTARYPDMESIAAVLDDLYGAHIEPAVRKKGELQCIGFYADFIDDAFVPGEHGILSRVTELMGQMLLEPATSGGRLRADYVDGERENLIDDIKAEINDKRSYAVRRMTELMCKNERYGVSKIGYLNEAQKITVGTLTKHYKNVIATSDMEVFYCGPSDVDTVEQTVKEALAGLPRTEKIDAPATEVVFIPTADEPRYFTEKMDVTQGKLVMGFRVGEVMKNPDHATLMVLNAIYGGSVTSKLFMNVREKLSLCYYASSAIDRHKGIMYVSSGVDPDKYDEALTEIMAQLDAVKRGEIEDWEFDTAKKTVVTAISSAVDSQYGLEALYLDRSILGLQPTPEELAGLADDVRLDDVIKASQDIRLDTVYFLTGEDKDVEA